MRPAHAVVCLVLAAGCASARPQVADPAAGSTSSTEMDGGAASWTDDASVAGDGASVGARLRRSSPEVAWLVAHMADEPDPARHGDSDAVRRLAAYGPEGVRAAVEVFRVGDARRVPFARRVLERAALRSCRSDQGRAGARVRWMVTGSLEAPIADAGIAWSDLLVRWPEARIQRVQAWADAGLPCAAADDGGV